MCPARAIRAFWTRCSTHGASAAHPSRVRSSRHWYIPLATVRRNCKADDDAGCVVAWLRLRPAVAGRRVSALTSLFKEAVLSQHQLIHGEPPAVLHGHGFERSGYDLARYLALPDVGFPRSRGRIHGLALWLPRDADEVTRAKVSRCGLRGAGAQGSRGRGGRLPSGRRAAALGSPPAPMAATVSGVGDRVSRRSREARQGALAGGCSMVRARGSPGAGFVSSVPFSARFGRRGSDAGRGQSPRPARASVLPRGNMVLAAGSGARRDRSRPPAGARPVRACR